MAVESNITEHTYKPGSAMAPEALTGLVFLDPDDLVVEHWADGATAGTLVLRDLNYTIEGDGAAGAATITALEAYATDDEFRIRRESPALQPEILPKFSPLSAKDVERGLDRQALVLQQHGRDIQRSVRAPFGEVVADLPVADLRASGFLGFDVNGGFAVYPQTPEIGDGYVDYPFTLAADDTEIAIPVEVQGYPLSVLINLQEIRVDDDYSQSSTAITLVQPANEGDEARLRVQLPAIMMQASPENIRWKRQFLTAAGYRSLTAKASDRFDYRDMLGYDLTGSHEQVSVLNAALAESVRSGDILHLPGGIIVVGSTLTWPGKAKVDGGGTTPYLTTINAQSRGPGSWIHLAHSGEGVVMGDGGALTSGISMQGVGLFRDQPVVTTGWEPYDHAHDIVINNADVELDEIMLFNATRGIKLANGQAGRLRIGTLRGQPLVVGLEVEQSLDILKADLIHFWPFWANLDPVNAFSAANLDAVQLYRADGPHIDTLFSIFARSTLRLSQNAYGKTTGGKISQLYCDGHGAAGLAVDSNVDAAIIQIGLMNGQGKDALASTRSILIDGDNCQIDISQHRSTLTGAEVFKSTGTGNNIRITMPAASNFNQDDDGYAAYAPGANDTLTLGMASQISGSNNGGAVYGGSGAISAPDHWTSIVPTVTPEAGSITSLGEYYLKFRQTGDTIEAYGKIVITDAGTGTGALLVQIPYVSIDDASGSGRQVAGGTASICTVSLGAGGSNVAISGEGSATPIATGAVITFNIRYRV